MFKLIALIRDKFRQDGIDFNELPLPAFTIDSRSSPVEIRFELDVRNDRNFAAWSQRWRTKAFEEGHYGVQPFEEKVGTRRAVIASRQKAGVTDKPAAAAAKVVHLNGGPLAA